MAETEKRLPGVFEGLSTDDAVLDTVPLEVLEEQISGMAARIAAATAAWLVWVAAYDRREGWATWGAKSCAHWLNWQCGMSPRTAREHVSVARRLEHFEQLRTAFLAGELSFSKVRAICRVIEPENETELIETAMVSTASQLDRLVAKMTPTDNDSHEDTVCDVTFTNNGDGTMTMTITAPIDDMSNVKRSVQRESSAVIEREHVDGETKSDTIIRLDGMNAIRSRTAVELLTGVRESREAADPTVLIVADLDALTGADETAESTVDSQRVDPAVTQRLCCDTKIQTLVVDGNGAELATGSEQRIVPRRIRRLVLRRDHGMCQFPGCESVHRLHAHHIIHWTNGGPTELDNLISLCSFHHHKVHEGGWNIHTTTAGLTFTDPLGNNIHVPVLRLPTTRPLPDTEATKNGAAAPLAGTGERANLDFIADVIIGNAELQRE